ncbi:hypothetical protein CR513_11676, partial [Mucuna pruriens]
MASKRMTELGIMPPMLSYRLKQRWSGTMVGKMDDDSVLITTNILAIATNCKDEGFIFSKDSNKVITTRSINLAFYEMRGPILSSKVEARKYMSSINLKPICKSQKMLAVFGFQDVIKVVTDGFVEPGRNATEEKRLIFKQQQKLDSKELFLIYQCVNSKIFNKISSASTSKEAWEILVKTYGDGEKNKKVKLQTLRRQYELLEMKD